MDFWNDGNENECEKCGYGHDLHGHGSYNEVSEKWTYYLCSDCGAAEAAEIAAKNASDEQNTEAAISMHVSMS